MNKFAVGTLVAAVLALLGVGANAAYESHQTNKKIGKSIEELKNSSVRDISESLIREAVELAAGQSVDKYIRDDNLLIMAKAKEKLSSDITRLVSSRYDEVTNEVSNRITSQITALDNPERLRKEVVEKAKSVLVSRFDTDLNDLRDKAKEGFEDANDQYEQKLEELSDKFESKLDAKLEDYSEHLATMKKLSDVIENAFGGRKGDRDGKEIRFTLG